MGIFHFKMLMGMFSFRIIHGDVLFIPEHIKGRFTQKQPNEWKYLRSLQFNNGPIVVITITIKLNSISIPNFSSIFMQAAYLGWQIDTFVIGGVQTEKKSY